MLSSHYEISKYAWDVYNQSSDFENQLPINVQQKNVFLRIFHFGGTSVICIRGSEDKWDWLQNICRWKKQFLEGSRVHSGFLAHTRTAKELLKGIILSKNILICGHSLGGGVATLLGVDMAISDPDTVIKVVTFGAPRVGDREFRDLCEQVSNLQIDRVVNPNDLITKVPYFGYYHVGSEYLGVPGYSSQLLKNHSMDKYSSEAFYSRL
jgi:predicted lipase